MQEYPIKHAVSFHSSIARAKAFDNSQDRITEVIADFEPIDSFHVTGATPTSERSKTMKAFSESPKALITNARCLTEGVDIPNIDCVLFADPKRSTIDIVQAVGRALRISKGKKYGYVIIPVLAEELDGEQAINDDSYSDLLLTLRALASNDDRNIEYFRLKNERGLSKGQRSSTDELVEIFGQRIDLEKLVGDIELRIWSRLGKLSWRSFEEARAFVQSLGLTNQSEWIQYCRSGGKTVDIPVSPERVYKDNGWNGIGDWLGTGTIASQLKEFRSFEEAKTFVHSLRFKNEGEWRQYCRSGDKPQDIPADPGGTYKHKGWNGIGDWLGTGTIANQFREYMSFEKARAFVHSLGLKSGTEWKQYCKSGEKPEDIPANPKPVYNKMGWSGMGDWLGTGTIASFLKEFRSFEKAKAFVQSLGLQTEDEWLQYCKSGVKPEDIPNTPRHIYWDQGWKGIGDWLGSETIANQFKEYRSFDDAREFVHSLDLKKSSEWWQYCKSGKKPEDIPSDPRNKYLNEGWNGWGDWLGTNSIATFLQDHRSFKEARAFVHSLGLKNSSDWFRYCKSGENPGDIPADPRKVYKNKGWKSMGDWLGTGTISNQVKEYKSFNEARAFVHLLGLKSGTEWKQYCKSGEKPEDIPSYPDHLYADQGWNGMGDWLGRKT
ncbi:MAG: hypothetical protein IPL46_08120 [Saprospiraceae bacterium]|nr:hypothetical protein [Saprospiraceae bacterium]